MWCEFHVKKNWKKKDEKKKPRVDQNTVQSVIISKKKKKSRGVSLFEKVNTGHLSFFLIS